MWSNNFNAVEPQFCIQVVGVVSIVTDQVLRGRREQHLITNVTSWGLAFLVRAAPRTVMERW
jgi:hypothetical protein